MPSTHDQTGDRTRSTTIEIIRVTETPQFVKAASEADLYGPEAGLPRESYADPAGKQFPCHTPAACWLSAAFLNRSREALGEKAASVERRLRELSAFHRVGEDVARLLDTKKEAEAPVSDEEYALVQQVGEQTYRWFRVSNAADVKAAAVYLDSWQKEIEPEDRKKMAMRVLARVQQLQLELPLATQSVLAKHAGQVLASVGALAREFRARETFARRDDQTELSEQLGKIAIAIEKNPRSSRLNAGTLIQRLEELDREQGWASLYNSFCTEPAQLALTKEAALQHQDNLCELTSGSTYHAEDLGRLNPETVREALGDSVVEEALKVGGDRPELDGQKFAAIARTLPRPDACILERLLADIQVQPLVKAASVSAGWLTDDAMQDLYQVVS